MSRLEDTVQTAKRHPIKLTTATVLVGAITTLNMLDINPLDFIVENSSAYEVRMEEITSDLAQLRFESLILKNKLSHTEHIIKTQNMMLQKMLQTDLITVSEFLSATHSEAHSPLPPAEEDDTR